MEHTKLVGLIREKNERRERDTLKIAENLIEEIAQQQACIKGCEKRIAEIRTALKALTVEQIDAKELLGE